MEIIKPEGYVRRAFPSYDGVTKTKWIAELRSGISQSRRNLKDESGECCLGVLCRLQGRLKFDSGFWEDSGNRQTIPPENDYYYFLDGLGSFPCDCYVEFGSNYYSLARCNDAGCSFEQIAEIIDAFWYDPETETP